MLDLAIKARLPVLRATTSDTVNLPEVLEYLAPEVTVAKWNVKLVGGDVFYVTEPLAVNETTYSHLVDQAKTLILINQDDESGLAVPCGEVPVPPELMFDLVAGVTDNKLAKKLMVAFRGLTLKAASEVLGLIRASSQPITVATVLAERSHLVGRLKGLALIETATECYLPSIELANWVQAEKPYFENASDHRLVPRGLLFDGEAGTGKTQGAKYIAREFGVPLYRLDMSTSLTRWMGESEQNIGRALSILDNEEPCVLLIDEVEKLFESGGEDSGTTSRILSQLLWWGQEHRSRILTVMTTNKREALPPELYRFGRVDRIMVFQKMQTAQQQELVTALCKSFGIIPSAKLYTGTVHKTDSTPAAVTQRVLDYLKQNKKCLGG